MKALSSFTTTFRKSKLSGKIAISCSVLLLLCLCTSVPIGLLSNSTITQAPTAHDILTPIYETAQAIALSTLTQTANLPTAALELTNTLIEPTDTSLPILPTATFESSVALPPNVPACVPASSTREEGLVIAIVDGDTIDVAIGNETYRVRYIGVDTPEKNEALYWLATGENQNLVYAKPITLVKDVSETDQFNQLLRYIFVDDTFVNSELVKRGYAHASTYPPDDACADYFAEAQSQAQAELVGLWAPAPSINLNPIVPTQPSSYTAPTSKPSRPSSCCKICTTGKACGNSCISRSYTCHQPPGCACDG